MSAFGRLARACLLTVAFAGLSVGGYHLAFAQGNLLETPTDDSTNQTTERRPVTQAVPTIERQCPDTATVVENYGFSSPADKITLAVEPGSEFETTFRVTNTGTTAWCGPNTLTGNGADHEFSLQPYQSEQLRFGATMTEAGLVYPGETAEFTLTGVAPSLAGIYRERFVAEVNGLELNATEFHEEVEPLFYFDLDVNSTEEDQEKLIYIKGTGNTAEFELTDPLRLIVDLEIPRMFVYKGEALVHEYVVSPGAWQTPTPVGNYVVYNKQELRIGGAAPHYRMPYWVGLRRPGGNFRGYGLHALPYLGEKKEDSYFWREAVDHLGTFVSHGCVRMGDVNAEWLWHLIDPENTTIHVVRGYDTVAGPSSV